MGVCLCWPWPPASNDCSGSASWVAVATRRCCCTGPFTVSQAQHGDFKSGKSGAWFSPSWVKPQMHSPLQLPPLPIPAYSILLSFCLWRSTLLPQVGYLCMCVCTCGVEGANDPCPVSSMVTGFLTEPGAHRSGCLTSKAWGLPVSAP